MNKTRGSLFLCLLVTTSSILSVINQNSQDSEYIETIKKSRRRLNRKKRTESAAPILDKEAAEKITTLDQTCQPQVLHFKTNEPEVKTEKDKNLCMFLNELEFTQDGMASFFSHTFNRREYAADFLPHNFSHLQQFLEYGKQMKQPHEYFDGVLRLFNTKLKGSSFVNCSALEQMLHKATPLLVEQFPQEKLSLWKDLKKILWTNFRDNFSFLKSQPMNFFEDISDQIIQQVKLKVTTPDRFRATIVRFLGIGIDKLAWSPEDQLQTWRSFKSIADQLNTLYDKGVINDSFDLNELYWGLIERYCFFLELTGSILSLETCQQMKDDLNSGKLKWLQLEEQEEGLQTKTERIVYSIMGTEAKIRIAKEGILTEIIPYQHNF